MQEKVDRLTQEAEQYTGPSQEETQQLNREKTDKDLLVMAQLPAKIPFTRTASCVQLSITLSGKAVKFCFDESQ